MKKIIFFTLAFFAGIVSFSQTIRLSDGRLIYKNPIDSAMAASLCGKQWLWDEGREDNRKLGAYVFSLRYHENGTVNFNNRKEFSFWKISSGHRLLHAADSGLLNKEPHPYGLFSGAYTLKVLGDTQLVLSTIPKNKKEKPTVFHLFKAQEKPELKLNSPTVRNDVFQALLIDIAFSSAKEQYTTVYISVFDTLNYSKMVHQKNSSDYLLLKNGQELDSLSFENDLMHLRKIHTEKNREVKTTYLNGKHPYKIVDYGNGQKEFFLVGDKKSNP